MLSTFHSTLVNLTRKVYPKIISDTESSGNFSAKGVAGFRRSVDPQEVESQKLVYLFFDFSTSKYTK